MVKRSSLQALLLGIGAAAVSIFGAGSLHAQTTNYAYDALGRLVDVTRSDSPSTTYAYDAAGNRSRVIVADPQPSVVARDDVVYLGVGETRTILVLQNDTGEGLTIINTGNAVGTAWSVDDDVKVIFWGVATPGTYGIDYTISDSQGRTATARVTVHVS
ncbi:Ig-like domain-containing protein [Brevundimonas diminuta]|uniref:Ig-like domain-containing protein n=1 Tax=Brevundimonas diminuta TaxID=293 RepID=UPI0030F9AE98